MRSPAPTHRGQSRPTPHLPGLPGPPVCAAVHGCSWTHACPSTQHAGRTANSMHNAAWRWRHGCRCQGPRTAWELAAAPCPRLDGQCSATVPPMVGSFAPCPLPITVQACSMVAVATLALCAALSVQPLVWRPPPVIDTARLQSGSRSPAVAVAPPGPPVGPSLVARTHETGPTRGPAPLLLCGIAASCPLPWPHRSWCHPLHVARTRYYLFHNAKKERVQCSAFSTGASAAHAPPPDTWFPFWMRGWCACVRCARPAKRARAYCEIRPPRACR